MQRFINRYIQICSLSPSSAVALQNQQSSPLLSLFTNQTRWSRCVLGGVLFPTNFKPDSLLYEGYAKAATINYKQFI